MMLSRAELVALEQAVVRGWPALESTTIAGWIARWSSGGSVRANSVAALAFEGGDLDLALAQVAAFYRRNGGVAKFTIADVSEPAGLDKELERRGWRRSGDHVTMAKAVDAEARRTRQSTSMGRFEVDRMDRPTSAWSDVYLQGLSDNRKAVAMRLVEGIPAPRTFFLGKRDGEPIASGLSVHDGGFASVQCMATAAAARRTGAATCVLAMIEQCASESGVKHLYLQADAANGAAVALYSRVGFQVVGRYHTRELVG